MIENNKKRKLGEGIDNKWISEKMLAMSSNDLDAEMLGSKLETI